MFQATNAKLSCCRYVPSALLPVQATVTSIVAVGAVALQKSANCSKAEVSLTKVAIKGTLKADDQATGILPQTLMKFDRRHGKWRPISSRPLQASRQRAARRSV